jgi:hypothetical protein
LSVFNISFEFSGIIFLNFFRWAGSGVLNLVFSVSFDFVGKVFSKFVSVVQGISE